MARRPSRRSKSTTIDFTGVESRRTPDEGTYNLVVEEVTKESGDRADYFKWQFKIADGDFEGVSVYHNTSLSPQSLWNLKNLLEALGEEVPDGPLDIDLAELVGKEVSAEIIHEKYEGRNMARISEFAEADEAPKKRKKDEDEDEDEKPRRGRRAKPADDDDEDEKPKRRRGRKPADEDEDEDEDEKPKRRGRRAAADDDEDEDEKPKRGSKKKPVKEEEDTITSEDVNGMSQEELEELIEEHDLDVKLSSLKTLRKMRAAVIEAGEEAGIIED